MQNSKHATLKRGEKVAAYATVVTCFLFVGKMIAALLSNSVALLGDAIHSFSDIFAVLASWFGLRIAQRDPDERFPYGYYRVETLVSLVVAVIICVAGFDILFESISQIRAPSEVKLVYLASSAAIGSIIVSFALFLFIRQTGKEIGSQALLVTAEDKKVDVLTSTLVFVSIVFASIGVLQAGGIVGLGIALLILREGIISVKDSTLILLDAWTDPQISESVHNTITQIKGIRVLKNLKLRKSGPYIFGSAVVGVTGSLDTKRAHEITEKIEKELKHEVKKLDGFTVHVEPARGEKLQIGFPVNEKKDLASKLSNHFGRALYHLIVTVNKGIIEYTAIKENPYVEKEVRAGLATTYQILDEQIDILITKQLGEISFHTLRDGYVEIYKTDAETVEEALRLFLDDKLARMERPTRKKD